MSAPRPLEVAAWILGSIASSVGIILVNKVIMSTFNFKYVFTLTALHFLITTIGMEIMCWMGMFQRKYMPLKDSIYMAVMCIGSVAFMNFSLTWNTVGFYQVLKLLCIPCMVFIESNFYGKTFNRKIKTVLFIVLMGVAIATVTDVKLNLMGSIFGALAVVFTAQFQILQGEKQRQHQLNPMQINHANSPASFVLCAICALLLECSGNEEETNVLLHTFAANEPAWIFLSCILAISVNLCSYGLIGKTSGVTYQVVGHAKTCLVLVGGYLMFPIQQTSEQLMKNIMGIILAMLGVILYGNVKAADAVNPRPADLLDQYLPASILNWINEKDRRAAGYQQVSQTEMTAKV